MYIYVYICMCIYVFMIYVFMYTCLYLYIYIYKYVFCRCDVYLWLARILRKHVPDRHFLEDCRLFFFISKKTINVFTSGQPLTSDQRKVRIPPSCALP